MILTANLKIYENLKTRQLNRKQDQQATEETRGGSKTAATSKMEVFVIIVNGFEPLTIITKCSILDVAAALDPPLETEIIQTILNGHVN